MTGKKAALEAILFAAGEPVGVDRLAQALELESGQIRALAAQLTEEFRQRESGLQILCLENHYQMCSAPCHGEMVRRVLDLRRNVPLSQAAMEVLAVVAYNQPVTKSFVEQVRGVDCSRILGSLIVKGLLEERGRLELPGRPLLYGTTPDFLRCLGLRSLEELPPLPPLDGTERESLENQTEEHSSACQE